MVYFSIDIHIDTFEGDGFICKPVISIYDTTFRGVVNQLRDIISYNARSQISYAYVWYMGRNREGNNETLSYKYYNGEDFIAMIKKALGEEFL